MYLVLLFQEALHPFHLDIVLILYRNREGSDSPTVFLNSNYLFVCLSSKQKFHLCQQQGHCFKINLLVITAERYLTVETIASVLEVHVHTYIRMCI